MGTSKDYGGKTGGAWRTSKLVASRIARDGPSERLIRDYARAFTEALGGPASAAASAQAAARVGGGLGGFLSSAQRDGVGRALEELGLGEAVGQPTTVLLAMLVDALAGDGATLEEASAREALLDCLEEEFGDAATYEEIAAIAVTPDRIEHLLARFVGWSVYRRCLPLIAARLGRATPAVRNATERDLREFAHAAAVVAMRGVNASRFNPTGPGMREVVQEILESAYAVYGGEA